MDKTKQNKIMNIMLVIAIVLAITAVLMIILINSGKTGNRQGNDSSNIKDSRNSSGIKVTFIELGSVRCIPCKMMQPVMEAIGKKYPDTVKVVFHDVWTDEGKPYGELYNIKAIPTQIFLDSKQVEYFRHEGFFPLEELEAILKKKL